MRKISSIHRISIPLILLLIAGIFIFRKEQKPESTEENGPTPKIEEPSLHPPEPNLASLTEQLLTSRLNPPQQLAQQVELARSRMVIMKELIKTDPGRALKESISWSEWKRLPNVLKPYVEEPISAQANVDIFIACGETTFIDHFTTLSSGRKFETFTDHSRRLAKTKTGLPVQGIRLDNIGALESSVFEHLNDEDHLAVISIFPIANPDPTRCFASGRKLTTPPIAALSGGKIFYFEDQKALKQLEQELYELDTLNGPESASALLFSALTSNSPENGFDLELARQLAATAAADWSGSARDMYVILVDFSDRPGQPVDPLLLENNIDTVVSSQIYDMSYHQTYINVTVDPITYRLPHESEFYTSDHRPMHDHAVNVVTNSGVDLSEYETVCIYFPYVPGLATLGGYASLGGSKLWLHNTADPYVITHELGHNYGSYHSHFWNTSGTNPLDPAGIHEEYGDITDIMGSGRPPNGHFHVQNKLEVGWLESDQILPLTNSGTYRIHRTDHPLTDQDSLFGLKFQIDPTNAYWIGYRQLYPEYESFGRGTYILWQQANPSNYPKSHLLDMTPGSADGIQDAALALGKTWSDPITQLHITPTQRGGSTPNEWMDVTINLGKFGSNQPPVSTLSGPHNVSTRHSITYAVNASDPDGDNLAYAWDFGDGIVRANSPQTSHVWFAPGTQTVSCIISDMKGSTVTNAITVTTSEQLLWPHQQRITSYQLMDLATDGNTLVVAGLYGFIATSTNGVDWTPQSLGPGTGSIHLRCLIYDGSEYIAAGMDYDSSLAGVIYTSPDGITWTQRYHGGSYLTGLTHKGTMKIAVGANGTILRSTSGLLWTPVDTGISINLLDVSNNGNLFSAIGDAADNSLAAYISVDGSKWINFSNSTQTELTHIQNCNGQLLASGYGAGIYRSIDGGQSFSSVNDDGLYIPAFAYGNGTYLAAGRYFAGNKADINLLSADGINWSPISTDLQNDRNAAIFFDNCFITAGQSGSIWKSEPIGDQNSGWAVWQYQNAETLALNRDAGDDPDGDGVFNLVEYALGTDPSNPGSTPAVTSNIDLNGYLQIAIERSRTAEDINYVVERGTNLLDTINWSALNTATVTNLPTQLIIRSTYPINAQDREFLRLRIGIKPPGGI